VFYLVKEFSGLGSELKTNSPKFLKVNSSYNKRSEKKVLDLQKKFGITSESWLNLYEDPMKAKLMLEISEIAKDPNNRTYTYNLNLRGLLQYILWAYDYGKINAKKIDTIVKNLSQLTSGEGLSFLKYLEGFDLEYKKDILIEISMALRSQLLDATIEHLRHYFILRCYEEISFWPAFEDRNLFRHLSKEKEKNYIFSLRGYKVEILNSLIPTNTCKRYEQHRLQSMKEDLKMTKQSLIKPL
jgi:hypothetical protein